MGAISNRIIRELYFLELAAYEAYSNAQYLQCSILNDRIIEISESVDLQQQVVRAKFWKTESLRLIGRYKQALAEGMDAVSKKYPNADHRDTFNVYTNIIALGLSLPTSLRAIENSIQSAYRFAEHVGLPHWSAKLLLLESNLYRNRGMFDLALEKLQQAWAVTKSEYPSYTVDTYMKGFVKLLVKMEKLDLANEYLEKWQTLENSQPTRRIKRMMLRQIQYQRALCNKTETLNLARGYNQQFSSLYDTHPMIEAFIANGYCDLAKPLLTKYLFSARNSESLYQLMFNYRLIGDYHHAKLRQLSGLPPTDMRYDSNETFVVEPAHQLLATAMQKNEWRKAVDAYKSAHELAAEIDGKLDCNYNVNEYNVKLKRLDCYR